MTILRMVTIIGMVTILDIVAVLGTFTILRDSYLRLSELKIHWVAQKIRNLKSVEGRRGGTQFLAALQFWLS